MERRILAAVALADVFVCEVWPWLAAVVALCGAAFVILYVTRQ